MKQILIVDDDVSIGDMLEEILTKEGYGVSRAYSGTEALLLLSDCRQSPGQKSGFFFYQVFHISNFFP